MSGAYIGRVGLCGAFGPYSKDSRRAGEGRHRHARSPGRADVKSYDEAGCTSLLGTNLETAKTPLRLAMLHWRSEADTCVTRYGRLRLRQCLAFCRRTCCAVDQQQSKNPPLRVDPASARRTVSLEPWLFHGPRSFSPDPRRHEGARKDRRLQAGEFPQLLGIIF